MTRKDDQIIEIEIIHSNSMSANDAIVVVTWGDRSKSMWFATCYNKREVNKYQEKRYKRL